MNSDADSQELEFARLALERARYRADIVKWLILAVGAVISFAVIDYGRLQLEKFSAESENERALLNAYLDASDTVQPDIWVRKLEVVRTLSTQPSLRAWADGELHYIRKCAAKEAVYRETLQTAAALLRPDRNATPAWVAARQRFEQLYWADLPYVKESGAVAGAMIAFRKALISIDSGGSERSNTEAALNGAMIELANALAEDDPRADSDCGRGSG